MKNLLIVKTADGTDEGPPAQIRLGWEGQVGRTIPKSLQSDGAGKKSVLATVNDVDISLLEPRAQVSLAAPFAIKGIRLEEFDDSAIKPYQISTILSGSLQFFSYGVALAKIDIAPGALLHFSGLDAEVTNLASDAAGLNLRLFGRAEDVQLGYGSVSSSIFPSAFSGLGALPSVRVALSTIFGILVSMIGATAIRARSITPLTEGNDENPAEMAGGKVTTTSEQSVVSADPNSPDGEPAAKDGEEKVL